MNRVLLLPLLFTLCLPAAVRAEEEGEKAASAEFLKNAALFQNRCSKCHTIGKGDRVGPDLKGLASRRDKEWVVGFLGQTGTYLDTDPEARKLVEKFNGVRMPDAALSRAQAEGILVFLETAEKGGLGGPEEKEPEPEDPLSKLKLPDEGARPWFPGIAGGLLFLAVAAAAWQLGVRAASGVALVLAGALGYWSLGGRRYHRLLGDQQGFAPVQPIAFSHKTHAGTLKVDCLYCHYGARSSDAAGVPPAQVCMNCHKSVRKVQGSDVPSAEIAKLVDAWETRLSSAPRAIAWNRVHDLPDYVHFSHKVHVANDVRCQECHGPVQTMERLRQAAPLSMGWCVNCHRQAADAAPTHWKRSRGPLDCAACHW